MKKFLSFVLVIVVFMLSFSLAERVDFTDYSDEELIKIKSSLDDEIAVRGIDCLILYQGLFEVGTFLEEGLYKITAIDGNVGCSVYRDYESYNSSSDGYLISNNTLTSGKSCSVYLTDGNLLKLVYGPASITKT